MVLLLTNDDGIDAPGLLALEKQLSEMADCVVVAPEEEQSACGHALSLRKPLRYRRLGDRRFALNGTPADNVYVGLHHLLSAKPALVVSGINDGANLSFDTYYSGTVAAAREAAMSGLGALAVSLCTDRSLVPKNADGSPRFPQRNWGTAASLAAFVVRRLLENPLPEGVYLNLNVPDVPLAEVRGLRTVRLGRRWWHPRVVERADPWGKAYLWIGGAHLGFGEIPDSDGPVVLEGFATLTPLGLDTTASAQTAHPACTPLDFEELHEKLEKTRSYHE